MAQTVHNAHVYIHPTEAIQVIGKTEAGRLIVAYLSPDAVDALRRTFAFEAIAGHLGHAYWHVKEGRTERCSMCHGDQPAPTLSLHKAAPQLLEALKRIGDPRMWRNRNGELTWAGETPDGNEIETDSPVAIARAAIDAALAAVRAAKGE